MTVSHRDPAAMTEGERFAEITDILAKGYLRLLVSRHSAQDHLDDRGQGEASCGANAHNPKSGETAA